MPVHPVGRIVVVEDDRRYRDSLRELFSHVEGCELAGVYPTADDFLKQAALAASGGSDVAGDLVLMDLQLPGTGGVEAIRRLKTLAPRAKVVALTVFEDPATILDAICAGADGYLLKRTPVPELLSQLRLVRAGGAPLTAGVARSVLSLLRTSGGHGLLSEQRRTRSSLDLTEREVEVLRALVEGLSYRQIATRLSVSIETIRSHVKAIYRKLQVHGVAEAVSRAVREGWV
jgi:DNA-binding NarL/FixJ family response regulator